MRKGRNAGSCGCGRKQTLASSFREAGQRRRRGSGHAYSGPFNSSEMIHCCDVSQGRNLSHLCPGESSVITGVRSAHHGHGNCSRQKLLSLGFLRGNTIEMVRRQGNSGFLVKVGTSQFMLNDNLAKMIAVASTE